MEKIEEINQRELVNVREELEMIRNRPFHVPNFQLTDNTEMINFKNYRKNPTEFLETVSYTHLDVYKRQDQYLALNNALNS